MNFTFLSLLGAVIGIISVQATAPMSKHCSPFMDGPVTISNDNGTELRVTFQWFGYDGSIFVSQPMEVQYPGVFSFYACQVDYMGYKNGTRIGKKSSRTSHVDYWGKIIFGTDYAHSDGELTGYCLEAIGKHDFTFNPCNEKDKDTNIRQWFRLRDYGLNKVIDHYPQVNTKKFNYNGQSLKYFHAHSIDSASNLTVGSRDAGWTMKMGLY